jgi:predicted nucleotidyltransferase
MNSNLTIDGKIIDVIKSASRYKCIRRIGIFGSYARGDAKDTSDLDLLYDYDETAENSTDEVLGYVEAVDELIKETISVKKVDYVWYKGVMESKNAKFREAVLRDVIWVYEA